MSQLYDTHLPFKLWVICAISPLMAFMEYVSTSITELDVVTTGYTTQGGSKQNASNYRLSSANKTLFRVVLVWLAATQYSKVAREHDKSERTQQ